MNRRRRWALPAVTGVLVLLAGFAVPAVMWTSRGTPGGPPPVSPASPGVPDRVGRPGAHAPSVRKSPPGAVGVVFGAPAWWLYGSKGDLALVGVGSDDYRLFHDDNGPYAGEQAVLAPDGTRLATVGQVVDLRTGTAAPMPDLDGRLAVPQAWSPDGRWLAVIGYQTDDRQSYDVPRVTRATLYLIDPRSGEHRVVGDLEPVGVHDGFTVAFAPDGARMAYQSGSAVAVATLDGTVRSRFTVGADSHLAGKGAWTRDGRGLTLVSLRRCCAGDRYPSRWRLVEVDPASGVPRDVPALPELSGLVAVRLLGWSPEGEAVVVAYLPDSGAPQDGFSLHADELPLSHDQLTSNEWVAAVQVLAVGPSAPQRTILTAPESIMLSVDIADDLVASGATRPGHPPDPGVDPVVVVLLIAAAGAVLLGGAATLAIVFAVRRARSRSVG